MNNATENDNNNGNYANYDSYDIYPDEEYSQITENTETAVSDNSLITFSLKIDSASYRNVVRYIDGGNLPPKDAVRIEEMINYFDYDEILPENDTPFSIYTELGESPFNTDKYLAFVRVKSKDIDRSKLPSSNLTFLIDTSGSMDSYDKLPLLKSAFSMLAETLTENDVVSIVTYAGSASVLLDGVRGDQKDKIISAIDSLSAGGSTAGADGINTAYALAEKNFFKNGNNRVILATDGDFNVGVSSVTDLEKLMSQKRDSGIYFTVLGFGTENLKDNKMETMAKNGNGNYHYIDCVDTAKKVLVDELSANLFTIADDVKAQVEFNPALVSTYRLIGYENSMLQNKDFTNDNKDAGEIGIGTDVILMFELGLTGTADEPVLKYQHNNTTTANIAAADNPYPDELFEVRIRYKNPGEDTSMLITQPVKKDRILDYNTNDFIFASSVAGFGQLLRSSEYTGSFTADEALEMAMDSIGKDTNGYRKDFIELIKAYQRIT
ncbi:MAG: VWA domain-containing protein [Oscillospiraceae bacterium]|nr:VWA domain-containing protein [Oscillospiraceae bacterium]